MSYFVMIKNEEWRAIADEDSVYWLPFEHNKGKTDIRNCEFPPKLFNEELIAGKEVGRASSFNIKKRQLKELGSKHGLLMIESTIFSFQDKRLFSGLFAAALVIVYFGLPISFKWLFSYFGYVFGRWVGDLFFRDSGYELKTLEKTFVHAKATFSEWQAYDLKLPQLMREHEERKTLAREKYLANAQARWQKYSTLRGLKNLDSLTGMEFENAIARLYTKLGYTTSLTPGSGDYGVDVLAVLGNKRIAIQAKRYGGAVGISAIQEVATGRLHYKANEAVVISSSTFTENAKLLAASSGVILIARSDLIKLWTSAYGNDLFESFTLPNYEKLKPEIDELVDGIHRSPIKRASPRRRRTRWRRY